MTCAPEPLRLCSPSLIALQGLSALLVSEGPKTEHGLLLLELALGLMHHCKLALLSESLKSNENLLLRSR